MFSRQRTIKWDEGKSKKPLLQRKPVVNQPGDVHEQQASSVADAIMQNGGATLPRTFFKPSPDNIQCAEAPDKTGNYISSLNGKGTPLTKNERQFFEPKLGHDFSQVRLHNDSEANESAKSINAKAYTSGPDIVFASGRYQPHSDDGKRLLAHELAHVVQQQSMQQVIQRERELNADESKECLQKVDEAIAALEKSAADENKKLPDYIKEAIKVLKEKRTQGKVKCYAFDGIKHGRVDYTKDEIQYDGINPSWINETSVLHEAVHALHGKQYSTSAKKFGKAVDQNKQIDENAGTNDVDLLRWKAWSEYWAYRSTQEYYNDKQKRTDDDIHKAVMQIHEVRIAVNNVRAHDQNFDPRTWKPK